MKTRAADPKWAIRRSIPGFLLAAHFLLLLLQSRMFPYGSTALQALFILYPIVVPIALFLSISVIRITIRSSGERANRRRCLAVAIVSLAGSVICGAIFTVALVAPYFESPEAKALRAEKGRTSWRAEKAERAARIYTTFAQQNPDDPKAGEARKRAEALQQPAVPPR